MHPFTAFLRSVLSLQALVIEGAHFDREARQAVIRVRRRAHAKPRCPQHGCVLGGRITSRTTRWRHLNLAATHLVLEAEQREGRCSRCDGRRMEAVPWASTRAKHTTHFERWVARLVQLTDKSAVAALASLAWRSVGFIVERVVEEIGPKDLFDDLLGITVDAVDAVRREECALLEGDERSDLKHMRIALLRNPRHLRPRGEEAIKRVQATNTRLTPLQRFARTIRSHMDGVLGFIRWGGTASGQAGGMNNKIKMLIHRAFGFHSAAAITLCCSGITPCPTDHVRRPHFLRHAS